MNKNTYMKKKDVLANIETELKIREVEEGILLFDKVTNSNEIIRCFASGIPELAIKISERGRMFDYILYAWNSSEELFKFKEKRPYSTAASLVDDICGTQNRDVVTFDEAIKNLLEAIKDEIKKDYDNPNSDEATKRGLEKMFNSID